MTQSLFALTGEALAIQQQINAAAEQLFSEDAAEIETATATLENLISAEADNRRAIEAKADAWCWVIDHIRAQAAARHEHARRLDALAEAAAHQAEVLQDRLITVLRRIDPDATTWKLPEHKISSRKVASVELDLDTMPADLPEQYQRTKTTVTADKTALKAALSSGAVIDGVKLVERRSWSIR